MTTYYVNARNGRDSADGTSANSAWRSIDQVNQAKFQPGDKILFHTGDVYKDTLEPSSSGSSSAPITFGSYGSGPAPVFDGGNGRDPGVLVKNVDYIRIEGLEVKSGYHGVSVIGSKGSELIDLEVHGSARDGILLKDSDGVLIQGGASYDNGTVGAAKDGTNLGHGVLVNSGTSNTTVDGMKLYKNAEDGVQFGNSSGNGNVISNNLIYNNLEDGIDIKQGSQTLSGNKIYGNDTNAVLIHNGSETITLTGNHLKTVDKANALDVGGSAKVVSKGNWYEGSESNTVQIQSNANGSSFKNDTFVDGGASVGVLIQGGKGHSFENSTFAMRDNGHAVRIQNDADDVRITDSILYGEGAGLIRMDAGTDLSLSNNAYWTTGVGAKWVQVGGSHKDSGYLEGQDNAAIVADPQFTNGEFALGSGSPAGGLGARTVIDRSPAGDSSTDAGKDPSGSDEAVSDGDSGSAEPENAVQGTKADNEIDGADSGDAIFGRGGNDVLRGRKGDDTLDGGAGNDRIQGGHGDDIIIGGTGSDKLHGWSGADTFVFRPGDGSDSIRAFEVGSDRIDLSAFELASVQDLLANAVQSDGMTVIEPMAGDQIAIDHPAHMDLSADDFIT